MGAEFYEDPDDFCEEHPDVVILATSILSTEPVMRSLPLTRLKRSTLVVDVLSVKVRRLGMSMNLRTGCLVECQVLAPSARPSALCLGLGTGQLQGLQLLEIALDRGMQLSATATISCSLCACAS